MLTSRFSAAALAAVLCVAHVSTVAAQLISEGVVYAYMTMRVGAAQQPVLMPMPADQVRPDLPLQATIPAAFGLLRNGKPATYGNSSVTATDALLAQERVAVHVDPTADAAAFEIIAAETVLTFAALGIERVVFPGRADEGLTAGDIDFATYRLQIPMWEALIGGRVALADIVLPDGDRIDAPQFFDRLADQDPRLTELALELVQSPDRAIRYYMLSVAERLGIAGYEAAVIPSLSHEDPLIREAAIRPLATSQSTAAWDALVAMIAADPEPRLREAAARAVAVAPLESYRMFEVFFRAGLPDRDVRLAALAEVGALRDPRVPSLLAPFLADADADARRLASDGLHAMGAWPELRGATADQALPPDVRLMAATALADSASGSDRLAGLEARGLALSGDLSAAVIDRVGALTDVDPRPTLERFLAHPDVVVAIYAARALAAEGDVAALAALSQVGQDAARPLDLQYAAADATLAIMARLRQSELDPYLQGRDRFLKRAAYRALGEFVRGGSTGGSVLAALNAGVADSDAGIRGASARGLAAYGNDSALEQILALEADPDAAVQADVALALQSFAGESFADRIGPALVGFVQGGEPTVIAAALDSISALQMRSLVALALEKVSYPDARVRAAALRAAAELADPGELRPVINAINASLRDEEVANRVLGARLLGRFNDALAVLSLSQVVNGPTPEVRYAAIAALGQTGHADAVGPLLALLEDPEREIRLAAVGALQALNLVAAIPGVQAQIARESDSVSRDALTGLVTHLQTSGS